MHRNRVARRLKPVLTVLGGPQSCCIFRRQCLGASDDDHGPYGFSNAQLPRPLAYRNAKVFWRTPDAKLLGVLGCSGRRPRPTVPFRPVSNCTAGFLRSRPFAGVAALRNQVCLSPSRSCRLLRNSHTRHNRSRHSPRCCLLLANPVRGAAMVACGGLLLRLGGVWWPRHGCRLHFRTPRGARCRGPYVPAVDWQTRRKLLREPSRCVVRHRPIYLLNVSYSAPSPFEWGQGRPGLCVGPGPDQFERHAAISMAPTCIHVWSWQSSRVSQAARRASGDSTGLCQAVSGYADILGMYARSDSCAVAPCRFECDIVASLPPAYLHPTPLCNVILPRAPESGTTRVP